MIVEFFVGFTVFRAPAGEYSIMTQTNQTSTRVPVAGYFVGIGFLITTVALVMMGSSADIPLVDQPQVRLEQITPGARRVALSDPPMINIGTLNQRCNDCHTLFENTREPGRALTQHTDVVLSHGSNDACLNCHDKGDREKLTLRGGKSVGYDEIEQLCAQCHGPIYRDWQRGTHGKTIGYWNTDLGEAVKLKCSECHDPHHPAYEPIAPLPGPNTLRMGDQHRTHDMINENNPLQRWRLLESESGSHDDAHGGDH